ALATVVAAPLGSYLGATVGWRGAFLCLVPLAVLPGFVYQLGNLLASVNATLQASIAQHHGHNYGLAMALVAGTVAIVITVLTFFGREGRVIQSAGAGHHQPLSTSR
ncbi:hypothetical protein ACMZ59_06625, partial [Klebsiella pneumoniae]